MYKLRLVFVYLIGDTNGYLENVVVTNWIHSISIFRHKSVFFKICRQGNIYGADENGFNR